MIYFKTFQTVFDKHDPKYSYPNFAVYIQNFSFLYKHANDIHKQHKKCRDKGICCGFRMLKKNQKPENLMQGILLHRKLV